MTPAQQPNAIIIGGSLSGLFVANTLRSIGWNVDIYERSPAALDSRGGGVVLQPEVLTAFKFSGIEPDQAVGVRSHNRTVLNRRGDTRSKQYAPQTQTSWNTIYHHLYQALPEHHYHRGKTFTHFEQDGDTVVAYFQDGTSVPGDLLIGADGGHSQVRQQVLPGVVPSYSGYVVWRGLVEEPRLSEASKALIYEDFVFQPDAESLMLEYMVPGVDGASDVQRRRFNWLWYLKAAPGPELDAILTDKNGRRREHSIPPGAIAPDQARRFIERAREQINPAFLELIELTEDIFVQSILDLKVPRMVFDRVLLLGDAAFIPRPHTAGSTAKAAHNAVSLAKALADHDDLSTALKRWEVSALQDGTGMSDWGIDMGNRIMNITA